MKFEIDKNVFISGLQQVINVVGTKLTMPIMSNVLVNAESGVVFLTTSNSDMSIKCSVKAEVKKAGSITLPAKKLINIIRSLPNPCVVVESNDNKTKISSGSSKFEITGLPAEGFPNISEEKVEAPQEVSFDQIVLARLLKNVSYAQSHDENRFILNGVYFCFESDRINFVATDGRRLSIVSEDIDAKNIESTGVIVPSKTINEIERMMGQGSKVKFSFTNKQINFYVDVDKESEKTGLVNNIFVTSKLVEGNYPNFKQVMPKEAKYRVKIGRELLLETLQRVSLVTSELKNSIRVRFSKNSLEVYAASPEYGEANETLPIQFDGEYTEIAFNPTFLCDPLKVLTHDEIFFEFNDALSPGVFKTLDKFVGIVMPLRVS